MYKIMAFLITNMIATTMVFAQHTRSNITNDVTQVLNNYSKLSEVKFNKSTQCSQKTTNRLVRNIDRRIDQALRTNETLDESIAKELKKYSVVRGRQVRMTKRILKRRWRVRRAYKKMRRTHPELTRSEFVKNLRSSITKESTEIQKLALINTLNEAGSMENYLLDMKDRVLNCDTNAFQSDSMGIVFLIIFIGLPVLSIISALFALIFGAYWWALGLFAFAVVLLLVWFIWANVESATPPEEEIELDIV